MIKILRRKPMRLIDVVRNQLVNVVKDIDAGNSTLTNDEAVAAMKAISKFTRKDLPLSKVSACEHLGVSRSKFDSLVREGKLPNGKKLPGFKELHWTKRDLDKAVKENSNVE
jgi:predicted DNA-binding transcriptional regulator AlpA